MALGAQDYLAGPFFAAAGLLLVAGAAKLRRPDHTSSALAAAALPSRLIFVRGLGAAEVVIGGACLVAPGMASALALFGMYLIFAGFLTHLIAKKVAAASCGCLGRRETPPSRLHIALNLVGCAVGLVVAFTGLPGIFPLAARLPFSGVSFLVGVVGIGYLAYLSVNFLPELFRAVRRGERQRSASPAEFAMAAR